MRENQLTPAVKKYIEIQYSPVTQGYLRQYCIDNGFSLTTRFDGETQDDKSFDFHSTVWYTTNTADITNGQAEVSVTDVEPKGFALFGPDEDILVLEIESEQLSAIRVDYGESYGLTDEWPEYRAHITLSYAYDGIMPEVALPDGTKITATTLNVKDQK